MLIVVVSFFHLDVIQFFFIVPVFTDQRMVVTNTLLLLVISHFFEQAAEAGQHTSLFLFSAVRFEFSLSVRLISDI